MNSSAEVENHEDRQVTFRRYQVKRKKINIYSQRAKIYNRSTDERCAFQMDRTND
jgi:hypothetical protein